MVCTYCSSGTQVINSRHQKRTNNVWRRRKCTVCKNVFTTTEQVDYEKSWVVQYVADKSQAFVRDKLLISINASLQHRPSALLDALGLTATVIGKLSKIVDADGLTSTAIATVTLETLRRFDTVAATVYQAFHADVL